VAMMDRPAEMRDLVQRNPDLFENIRNACCPSDEAWSDLESIFYAPRDQMDDLTWMRNIGDHLEANASLLAVLKELVGYDMYEEVADGSDIVRMRDNPEIMARLESDYPQFFANVQKAFDHDEYNRFIRALYAPRSTIPDDKWESLI
ncbi:hypothetical protein DFS34DRAFT_564234, partial [Phlyctochytrium arcticum]